MEDTIIEILKKMVIDGDESHIIDKKLESFNLNESKRKQIFKALQEFQVERLKEKQLLESRANLKLLSLTILILGLLITIGSYFYNPNKFVFAYGMISFGIYYFIKRKLNPDLEEDKPRSKSAFEKGLFKKLR